MDQCQYGLMLPDNNGTWGPVRKPTCFFTTKVSLYLGLQRTCAGQHQHVPIEGYVPGLGLRSEVVESYPPRLAKRLAQLLAAAPTDAELINAVEDDEAKKEEQGNVVSKEVEDQMPEADEIKQNKELRIKVGQRAFNYVARLHKNLGHPSAEVLAKMLEEVRATGDVMKAAQGYLCPKCYARKAPSGTAPAAGLTAKEFNTRLLIDSAWVDTDNGRRCVVTVMDQATAMWPSGCSRPSSRPTSSRAWSARG